MAWSFLWFHAKCFQVLEDQKRKKNETETRKVITSKVNASIKLSLQNKLFRREQFIEMFSSNPSNFSTLLLFDKSDV